MRHTDDHRGDHGALDTAAEWEHGYEADAETATVADPFILDQCRELTPGTALDLGCGTGANAVALADAGWTVTGVDWARNAIATARNRAAAASVDVRFDVADITVWKPDGAYDLVLSSYALPTGKEPDALGVAVAALARGGTLLVLELDPAMVTEWTGTTDVLVPEKVVTALDRLHIERMGVFDIDRADTDVLQNHNHGRSIFVRAIKPGA